MKLSLRKIISVAAFLILFLFVLPSGARASWLFGTDSGFGEDIGSIFSASGEIVAEKASSVIGTVAETAYKITLYVVFAVSSVILKLVGFLTLSFISIVDGILRYSDFASNETVQIGWSIVRDICNMFFIVILLIIAIATILRVGSYSVNQLLPKLLLMAVLINFSLVIAGILINGSQIVMLTFVDGFIGGSSPGSSAGTWASYFEVNKDLLASPDAFEGADGEVETAEVIDGVMSYIFAIIMVSITFFVLLVLTVVLIVRIIMLWFLLVLSPIAYIGAAFPQGQKYAQQWWQEFTKYLMIGPILAFFIWLSLSMATTTSNSVELATAENQAESSSYSVDPRTGIRTKKVDGDIVQARGEPSAMLGYMMSIGMLLLSLALAQQLGGVAGNFAGSVAGKIKSTGVGALKFGARSADKLQARALSGGLSRAAGGVLSKVKPFGIDRLGTKLKDFGEKGGLTGALGNYYAKQGGRRGKIGQAISGVARTGGLRVADIPEGFEAAMKGRAKKDQGLRTEASTDLFNAAINDKGPSKVKEGIFEKVGEARKKFADYDGSAIKAELVKKVKDSVAAGKKIPDGDLADVTALTQLAFEGKGLDDLQEAYGVADGGGVEDLQRAIARTLGGGTDPSKPGDALSREIIANLIQGSAIKGGYLPFGKMARRNKNGEYELTEINAAATSDGSAGRQEVFAAISNVEGKLPALQHDGFFKKDASGDYTDIHDEFKSKDTLEALLNNTISNPKQAFEPKALKILNTRDGADALMAAARAADPSGALADKADKALASVYLQQRGLEGKRGEQIETQLRPGSDYRNRFGTPPGPSPRIATLDGQKEARTAQRVGAYQALGQDFFKSQEFESNADQFISQAEYDRSQALAGRQDLGRLRGVKTASQVGYGAASNQASLGLDFNDPAVQRALNVQAGWGGAYLSGDLKTKAIPEILKLYREQLQKAGGNEGEINAQVANLQTGLENAETIALANNSSKDSLFDVVRHERAHSKVEKLTEAQIDEIYGSLPEQQRSAIDADMSQRYRGYDEKTRKREAVVEMVGVGKGAYGASGKTAELLNQAGIRARGQENIGRNISEALKEFGADIRAAMQEKDGLMRGIRAGVAEQNLKRAVGNADMSTVTPTVEAVMGAVKDNIEAQRTGAPVGDSATRLVQAIEKLETVGRSGAKVASGTPTPDTTGTLDNPALQNTAALDKLVTELVSKFDALDNASVASQLTTLSETLKKSLDEVGSKSGNQASLKELNTLLQSLRRLGRTPADKVDRVMLRKLLLSMNRNLLSIKKEVGDLDFPEEV